MTTQLFTSKSGFGFDSVALWNLKTTEKFLNSEIAKELTEQELSSLYASMIFHLYVYLEGNMNHGLKNILNSTPRNLALRKHVSEQTKWNVHPFEVIKWIDIEYSVNILDKVKSKYQEALKYHEILRNLIAHGGRVYSDGLHEWGEDFQVSISEPDAELKKIADFLKKNKIYQETEAGPGYITSLATLQIFDFFKNSCKRFVMDLIQGENANLGKAIFWSFSYEYFGIEHPGPSSY